MIDVHCHLNFQSFEKDCDDVLKKAHDSGVNKIINVGTKIDSSQKAVDLTETHKNLYAIVGVHPHHADKFSPPRHPERSEGSQDQKRKDSSSRQVGTQNDNGDDWVHELERLARNPKVVGIGECGLDYYRYKSNDIVDPILQKEVFIKQIKLAYKLRLPLQVHNRHAGKDIIDILMNHKSNLSNPPGMFHCMSGDMDLLKKVLNLGFYVGFDGNITYKGIAPGENTDLRDLVKYTPLDRILSETDSPFLAPEPKRGSRNIPENVIIVGKAIADIKGVSFERVKDQTNKNANRLFKLKG